MAVSYSKGIKISIHAPREGGDASSAGAFFASSISIHAPREGGDMDEVYFVGVLDISIHAPREGGDMPLRACGVIIIYFNPRPPRGGRLESLEAFRLRLLFQSTPPARGATTFSNAEDWIVRISIHAPREGGDRHGLPPCHLQAHISIHAPREGGDDRAAPPAS